MVLPESAASYLVFPEKIPKASLHVMAIPSGSLTHGLFVKNYLLNLKN